METNRGIHVQSDSIDMVTETGAADPVADRPTADLDAHGASLVVKDLRVKYGGVEAVHGISFSIRPGGFLTLLGPSGCGKSTTLRCIAGLEPPSGGSIEVAGETIATVSRQTPPEKRGINMVFQSYAVWPHMTVAKNVSYGLRGIPKDEIRDRTAAVLDLVGLSRFADRYGTELSGGQQQRVALARAIVTRPRLILFDEPLSNLDAGLREEMRYELLELQRTVGVTSVYVTHDQTEAMSMSDHVVLMNEGFIEQADRPREIYRRPRTEFAASFLGHANLITGVLDAAGSRLTASDADIVAVAEEALPGSAGEPASAVVRAERIHLGAAAEGLDNVWSGRVEHVSFLGRYLDVMVRVGGVPLRVEVRDGLPLEEGQAIAVGGRAADVHFVPRADRP